MAATLAATTIPDDTQPTRVPARSIAIDHHRSFAVSSDQSAASSKLSIAFLPADQN